MKMSEMDSMDNSTLHNKVNELRKDLFAVKMQRISKIEKPHLLREYRRNIARILTKVRMRELNNGK